ncbi:hypothetical protein Mal4_26530 [Maioricimonas rarisocia]|uniref:Fibronectin-binding protein n=1 Tax=Maioricimonas rarisocia TaxID=2528026 RepID=A0A517Z760_9PLAN|nr:hypothetical protein [Maioricimonas rarisocia]QDU38326.1 hypothetical protein Mal4_26530 [Maioricimonas rarisocia]
MTATRKRAIVWGCAILFAAILGNPAAAVADDTPPLAGKYRCVGTNPGGTKYEGTVTIAQKGETYLLTWSIAGGTHQGVGVVRKGMLCSSWATNAGGRVVTGIVVYEIKGKTLDGTWTMLPGTGEVLTETLTRIN